MIFGVFIFGQKILSWAPNFTILILVRIVALWEKSSFYIVTKSHSETHIPGNKIITRGQIHVSSNNLSSLLYLRSCSGWDGCSSFPIIRMFIQNVNCYVQCAHIPYLLWHFPRIERTIFPVHFRCLIWDFLLSLLFPVLIWKKIWIQFLKWTRVK